MGIVLVLIFTIPKKEIIEPESGLPKYSDTYYEASFFKEVDVVALSFNYSIQNADDADKLGIWVDNKLSFLKSAGEVGHGLHKGIINLSGLSTGDHNITISTYGGGDKKAETFVSNFVQLAVYARTDYNNPVDLDLKSHGFKGQGGLNGNIVILVENKSSITNNGSAFWDADFYIGEKKSAITFNYQFLNSGDGDELGIWVDDSLRFIITGELLGNEKRKSDIDISDLEPGEHRLTVALHGYGEENAEVVVSNFKLYSYVYAY